MTSVRILGLAVFLAVLGSGPLHADTQTLTRQATDLYDRPDGEVVGRLLRDVSVDPIGARDDWTNIQVVGWMHRSAFDEVPSLLARIKILTVSKDDTIRTGPGGDAFGRFFTGTRLHMLDADKKWLKTGLTVWVKSALLHRVDRTARSNPKEEEPVASASDQKSPSDTVAAKSAKDTPKVRLTTSHGDMVIELYPDKAPKTAANFLSYVRKSHYDGTIFHRVISNFMIQGGGYTSNYAEKPTDPPIPIESDNGLANARGTVAMARTNDPNSATSQFFINVVDNAFLNYKSAGQPGYAVFGRVIEGMETADKIRNVPTGAAGPFGSDVPKEAVVINKAEVLP